MATFLTREIHRLMTPVRCSSFSYAARTVALLMSLLALASLTPSQADTDQLSTDQSSKSSDQRLAHMVLGIISYTQWAKLGEPIHLCVIDSPYYFNALLPIQTDSQQQVRVSLKTAKTTDLTQQCHVLFFERTTPAQQQDIIHQRGVRRILTMSLNNPSCVVGSSFCIAIHQNVPSFSINLDSLKQSGVKISSKVLILSKPSLQQD